MKCWTQPESQSQKNKKKKKTQTPLFKSLNFEDWDLIWTELNYSDFTRVVLQTEAAAFLKPLQISIYMSLLHQQFCFFSWDAELCWKKPHSKTSAYRNSNSLAPKAVYLLKTGTKLNNKLNLSTSSWLGLNKHLFLRQQKTHFFKYF